MAWQIKMQHDIWLDILQLPPRSDGSCWMDHYHIFDTFDHFWHDAQSVLAPIPNPLRYPPLVTGGAYLVEPSRQHKTASAAMAGIWKCWLIPAELKDTMAHFRATHFSSEFFSPTVCFCSHWAFFSFTVYAQHRKMRLARAETAADTTQSHHIFTRENTLLRCAFNDLCSTYLRQPSHGPKGTNKHSFFCTAVENSKLAANNVNRYSTDAVMLTYDAAQLSTLCAWGKSLTLLSQRFHINTHTHGEPWLKGNMSNKFYIKLDICFLFCCKSQSSFNIHPSHCPVCHINHDLFERKTWNGNVLNSM